ncbi:MAG: hypothetical protein IT531_16030 [Burkholderiales bacterium]|nr:hypothetical protein [Burkholderiales bacterium]
MPFMLLIYGFLFATVVWAFYHYRPRGVNRKALEIYDALTQILAVVAAYYAGMWIYWGAAGMPEKQKIVAYLVFMSGGTAYLLVVAIAGLARNVAVFPRSRRAGPPEDHRID